MFAGRLSNKGRLPVTGLTFWASPGSRNSNNAYSKIHVGPLVCKGKEKVPNRKMCLILLLLN